MSAPTRIDASLAAAIAECERAVFSSPRPYDTRHPRQADLDAVMMQLPGILRGPTDTPRRRGVPMSELRYRFSGNDHLHDTARAWGKACAAAPPDVKSALFVGATGIGKTAAAAWCFRGLLAIAREAPTDPDDEAARAKLNRGLGLVWTTAAQLERQLREHRYGDDECPHRRRAAFASVLFLDELGHETDRRAFADLLDERYREARPTVITSNLTLDALSEAYPGSVLRRVEETGGPKRLMLADCHANPTRAPQ